MFLLEYKISNELANYITMALDSSSASIYEIMSEIHSDYCDEMDALAHELSQILEDLNMSLLDLFKALAVRCQDFLVFCQIHSQIYKGAACCQTVFRAEPIFSAVGTCFTTKAEIYEFIPYAISSLRFWTYVDPDLSPEFLIRYKLANAVDRSGVYHLSLIHI